MYSNQFLSYTGTKPLPYIYKYWSFNMLYWFHKSPYRKFSEISAALGNSATIINLPNNYWGNSPPPIHPRTHFTKSRPPSKFHWYKKKTFRFPKFAIDFRLLMIVSSAHIRQKTIGAKPEVGITFLRVEWNTAWAAPFGNKTCQQLEQVYNSMRNWRAAARLNK